MAQRFSLLACALISCICLMGSDALADRVCIKASTSRGRRVAISRRVVPSTANCPRGFLEIVDTVALTGPQGATGPAGVNGTNGSNGAPGADGQLRIYGNASAGSKTVSGMELLGDPNLQYGDFTVNAGGLLVVSSGTVIRCTGTFTNNGDIVVQLSARASRRDTPVAGTMITSFNLAQPGVARGAAGNSEVGDNTAERLGGVGGVGVNEGQARQLLFPGIHAGGGGGCGSPYCPSGSHGGGSLVILCQNGIVNNGTINAPGAGGSTYTGGGGGGVVIMASSGSVTNTATASILAPGGSGSPSDADTGPGGGGGGGIVHLIAPVVSSVGTINIAGGSAGTNIGPGTITSATRSGGGGGGACGGDGGKGGNAVGANPQSAESGFSGYSLTTLVDPTALF